jgi:hypothetical protein
VDAFECNNGEFGAFSTASRVATAMNNAQAIPTRTLMSVLSGITAIISDGDGGCGGFMEEVVANEVGSAKGVASPLVFNDVAPGPFPNCSTEPSPRGK